jgi:hypothetical protein
MVAEMHGHEKEYDQAGSEARLSDELIGEERVCLCGHQIRSGGLFTRQRKLNNDRRAPFADDTSFFI